jgi:(2Fe-2S) ferredoxin
MGQFQKHVFVCTSGKTCPRQGSEQILDLLKERVATAGLRDRIRINKCGCLGQCGNGPMVVVYPEDVWYAAVRPAGIDRLFQQHLVEGLPIPELFYAPRGRGVQVCPPGEEKVPPEPFAPAS